jgi:hypothetical protein
MTTGGLKPRYGALGGAQAFGDRMLSKGGLGTSLEHLAHQGVLEFERFVRRDEVGA